MDFCFKAPSDFRKHIPLIGLVDKASRLLEQTNRFRQYGIIISANMYAYNNEV